MFVMISPPIPLGLRSDSSSDVTTLPRADFSSTHPRSHRGSRASGRGKGRSNSHALAAVAPLVASDSDSNSNSALAPPTFSQAGQTQPSPPDALPSPPCKRPRLEAGSSSEASASSAASWQEASPPPLSTLLWSGLPDSITSLSSLVSFFQSQSQSKGNNSSVIEIADARFNPQRQTAVIRFATPRAGTGNSQRMY